MRFRKFIPYILLAFLLIWHTIVYAQEQRFPRPEFEQGYTFPTHQFLNQRGPMWEYMDVAVLITGLCITSWLVLKKRSRQGIVWVSLFTLAYFGFYRQGCICAVGSVQNVALALFNDHYAMPLSALLFFLIPLAFALFSGRVFCAGVCPLGAIQELTGFRQIKVPAKVESVLTAIPYVYLGIAVLASATESQFLICRYDPFVGIFRLDAPYTMIIFGSLLLVAGIFVNRPYCRYLCPYGVILNFFSRFSFRHLSITPAECRNCRLCETGCPYNVILASDPVRDPAPHEQGWKKSSVYMILIIIIAIGGGFIFKNLAPELSRLNANVQLANEIRLEKDKGIKADSKKASAYFESGRTEDDLFAEAESVTRRYKNGAPWVGIFLGLSLGIGLFRKTIRPIRTEYVPDRGRCYSCGKCFKYCPVKLKT